MLNEIDSADFVLVICSNAYYRRFRGHEEPGKGKGSDWEGAIITQALYEARSRTDKFVPVAMAPGQDDFIPEPLRGMTRYVLNNSADYRKLCEFLKGEAGVTPGPILDAPSKPKPAGTPILFPDEPVEAAVPSSGSPSLSRSGTLYGRDGLLSSVLPALKSSGRLLLYGMRGIGKSRVVEAISRESPWADWGLPLRVFAGATSNRNDVFRVFAQALGIPDENPRAPSGSVAEIMDALTPRLSSVHPALIWIDQAHCWFTRDQWCSPELGNLITALQRLTADRWHWVFELRERPPAPLQATARCFEIPGLDKSALAQWFGAAAPASQRPDWALSGDRLKAMYQWLGGGHGQQAHPLATSLLVEVALGTGSTPLQVRERLLSQPAQQIENLLSDLFHNVLSEPERKLLLALGLYRSWVPHDHVGWLEAGLDARGAWQGLDKRCLLPSDEHQERYFLHGFVSEWLRQILGYPAFDSDRTMTADAPAKNARARELHELIADCWLRQVQGHPRRSVLNIERALEAFHHVIAADRSNRLGEIAPTLISGREDGALERLWVLCDSMHARRRPRRELEIVLRLILEIDPHSHKAFRFLGESLQRIRGQADPEAVDCFRRAIELRPGFAPYLCNLGVALKASGPEGAREFLTLVSGARGSFPSAVNDQVVAVELRCIASLDPTSDEPSKRRRERIDAGSRHEAFYTDEAEWQLRRKPPDPDDALRVLDLAQARDCHGEFAAGTRAKALDAKGLHREAGAIREDLIRRGSLNAAVYHGQAMAFLNQRPPNADRALEVLDLASQLDCADEYTVSIRATALEAKGLGDEASRLRHEQIAAGSHTEAFYTAEADWQLGKRPSDANEAMRIVMLAKHRGCAAEHTASVEAKALEALGQPDAASRLRREWIDSDCRAEVFYTSEAHWQLHKRPPNPQEALRILDLAMQRGCADDYSASVRAAVLEVMGRGDEASSLRRSLIAAGTRSAAIYNAEAEWLLSRQPPDADAALQLLQVPRREGFADEFTDWSYAKAQKASRNHDVDGQR